MLKKRKKNAIIKVVFIWISNTNLKFNFQGKAIMLLVWTLLFELKYSYCKIIDAE